jgi:hypothetical protein
MQLEKNAEPQVPQRYFRQLERTAPMSIAKGDLSRVGCGADTPHLSHEGLYSKTHGELSVIARAVMARRYDPSNVAPRHSRENTFNSYPVWEWTADEHERKPFSAKDNWSCYFD